MRGREMRGRETRGYEMRGRETRGHEMRGRETRGATYTTTVTTLTSYPTTSITTTASTAVSIASSTVSTTISSTRVATYTNHHHYFRGLDTEIAHDGNAKTQIQIRRTGEQWKRDVGSESRYLDPISRFDFWI
ncbi:hypothetical protein F2Q69_00017499 [Brassica cretica]|uniref:Uncharacterized protein n=1 Tax=Brassica cretica TaxID=69181 RepID=A0A8S9QQN9_BRACR|nr:hypothetical protein F2Q69_00017499 [Brassica cretica]